MGVAYFKRLRINYYVERGSPHAARIRKRTATAHSSRCVCVVLTLSMILSTRIAVGNVRQRTLRDQIFKYTSNWWSSVETENLRVIVILL
jgi:hypothetical protein